MGFFSDLFGLVNGYAEEMVTEKKRREYVEIGYVDGIIDQLLRDLHGKGTVNDPYGEVDYAYVNSAISAVEEVSSSGNKLTVLDVMKKNGYNIEPFS